MPAQAPIAPAVAATPPLPAAHAPTLIALDGVTKAYDEGGATRVVLRDVSLRVAEGEFVAILGRSGSGKSTLLNLVAGIDAPTAGTVSVGGVDLTRLSDRDRTLFRRRTIGFVFQFFNLIPTLSVLENVRLPLELAGRRGRSADDAARALLQDVGLAARVDAFPDRLSGGEQQRVAIARALAADPPLLLADEPTGNLDAETGARVLDLLCRLSGERGRTLLMATHSRAVAARAHRVLAIDGDRLVDALPERVAGLAT